MSGHLTGGGEFTVSNPIPDEDWEDFVRWEVNDNWAENSWMHPLDGFFADIAGGPTCLALGHTPDEDGYWEDIEGHGSSWADDYLCYATKYGVCCTACESDDCPVLNRATDTKAFWRMFATSAEGATS